MDEEFFPSPEDNLFSASGDWWSTACLNWYRDGWSLYADGYKNSADALVEVVTAAGRKQDTFVYPIVFLYRQYLELAIKDLIRRCRSLQDISGAVRPVHRIDELWIECRKLLAEISPGEAEGELEQVGRLIQEFHAMDPSATAFRYPETKDGQPSLPDLDRVDLMNLGVVMGKIHNLLDGASSQVTEYLSLKSEMLREYSDD